MCTRIRPSLIRRVTCLATLWQWLFSRIGPVIRVVVVEQKLESEFLRVLGEGDGVVQIVWQFGRRVKQPEPHPGWTSLRRRIILDQILSLAILSTMGAVVGLITAVFGNVLNFIYLKFIKKTKANGHSAP